MALQDFTLNLKANADGLDKSIKKVTDRTYTVKLKADGSSIRTLTQDVTSADGKLQGVVKTMTKFDAQGRELNTTITQSTKHVKTWGQEFADSFGKVLRFGTITAIIGGFTKAMSDAVDVVKEFDSTLVEFRKVSDLAGDSLTAYTQKLAEMGEVTGSTMTAMVSAATEFKKSGYSDEDAATLASVAEMYRNISDEELSAGESANFIIAQLKAFNMTASESEHIIDAVNEVSNHYAVSSADLANNLGNVSAVLSVSGTTFEQTLGMLTSITEVTRNASKASRGLVQISSRLTQVLDDSSKTGKKLKDIYGGLGIELMDSNGQIRSTYDILEDLSKQWDNLSKNEQEYIALTSAGSNQVQNFSALMENFAVAIDATITAYNSSGSAAKENEKAMDTIEKKTELLRSQFEQLILGEGGLQSFAKGLLDVGIAILKFANSDVGQLTIAVGLAVTAVTLLHKAFIALTASNFGASIGMIVTEIGSLIAGTGTLTGAITALTISIEACPLFWGALAVGGIVAIIAVADKLNVTLDEQIEKLNEVKDAYESATQEVDSVSKTLESVRDRIAEINEQGTLNITDNVELQKLKEEEAVLANQLTILQEQARVKQEHYTNEAKKTLGKRFEDAGAFGTTDMDMGVVVTNEGTAVQALDAYNKKIQESQEEINKLLERKQALIDKGYSPESDAVGAVNDLIADEIATRDSARSSAVKYAQIIQEATQYANQEDEDVKQAKETLDEYHETIGKVKDSKEELTESDEDFINNLIEANELTEEQAESLRSQIADWVSEGNPFDEFDFDKAIEGFQGVEDKVLSVEEATKNLELALSDLTNMASAYDTLSNAVNEYNANGSLTLETLSNLTALGSDYISLLEVENGQMSINEKGLKALANSYIDEAEAKAYDKAMAELANDTNRAGLSAGQASASGSITAANGARTAAQEAINGADAWNLYWSSVTNGKYKGVSKTKLSNVGKSLQTQLSALESFRKSVGKNTVSAIKNTKATGGSSKARGGNSKATKANTKAVDDNTKALKANVDALKEQKEALEKEVDDYKKVIDYLNDKVDEEIDKLEEARDAEVQAIEDRIDEYEKLADAQEDSIDNEIDKLKEAKDAEEEYWNAQIDELEKANDAMEEQAKLEQLLQNLENARRKKVKVYREGKGFVYETDQDEVAKAKKELEDYQNQKALEDQINLLKKNRDDALSVYDKQIADLEDYKKRQKAKYDAIIEDLKKQVEQIKAKYDVPINALKEWKETFKKQTEAYEQEIARQLTIQKTGIDTESANWTTRLNNLDAFVSAYNAKLKELDDVNSKLESAEKAYNQAQQSASSYDYDDSGDGDGGGGGGGGGGSSEPSAPKTGNYKVLKFEKKFSNKTNAQKYIESLPVSKRGQYAFLEHGGAYYVYKKSNYKSYQGITESQAANYAQAYRGSAMYWAYASGAAKIGSNQMALVGDDPKHRELVIGSKLNGIAMQLSKGSGVVNAKSTNTFAGLLNALGSALNDGSAKGSILNNNSDNSSSMYIDKVVIEGSHITDIVSFKNSLMNLKSEATQRAYKHK